MEQTREIVWRQATPERVALLRRFKLDWGGHGNPLDVDDEDADKLSSALDKSCVLEAIAVITGQGVTDAPLCVSDVVRGLAITINDGGDLTNYVEEAQVPNPKFNPERDTWGEHLRWDIPRSTESQLQQLKKVIPELMGTAPFWRTTKRYADGRVAVFDAPVRVGDVNQYDRAEKARLAYLCTLEAYDALGQSSSMKSRIRVLRTVAAIDGSDE